MTEPCYFRPIPDSAGGRWRLAGGWVRFSRLERLARGKAPQIVDDAPEAVLATLTAPRPPILGLGMDAPRIMGILNVTPDSFSDGGRWTADSGIAHGRRLLAEGADLIDIGGESTRPGAAEIAVPDEIARVLPPIHALAAAAPLSIDTRKADVARAAVGAGAGLVNDVSGLDFDPAMAGAVARTGAAVCIMHAQGLPATGAAEGGGRLPAAIHQPFSTAMGQSMWLPAIILLIGVAATACYARPGHQGAPGARPEPTSQGQSSEAVPVGS